MGAEGIKCEHDKNIIIAETDSEFLESVDRLESDITYKNKLSSSALELIHEYYSWQGQLEPLDDLLDNSHTANG